MSLRCLSSRMKIYLGNCTLVFRIWMYNTEYGVLYAFDAALACGGGGVEMLASKYESA